MLDSRQAVKQSKACDHERTGRLSVGRVTRKRPAASSCRPETVMAVRAFHPSPSTHPAPDDDSL